MYIYHLTGNPLLPLRQQDAEIASANGLLDTHFEGAEGNNAESIAPVSEKEKAGNTKSIDTSSVPEIF